MRGCSASPLGSMRYRTVASSEFRQKHFANRLTRNAARKAPVVAYTRKDTLQSSFLLRRFGLPEGAYPCHYVPGAEPHFSAIRYGLGYGMVPELLLHEALRAGEVVDLAADEPLRSRSTGIPEGAIAANGTSVAADHRGGAEDPGATLSGFVCCGRDAAWPIRLPVVECCRYHVDLLRCRATP